MTEKKNILIINGANLNLLGKREPAIYGSTKFEDCLEELRKEFKDCRIDYFQSNIEGEIVNQLQSFRGDAVIINAGGYTHTSVVIRDAIQYRTDKSNADALKVFEVHISNIYSREEFRHTSLLSPVCNGSIIGFGLLGYKLAVLAVLNKD